jgi:hypothetical protein
MSMKRFIFIMTAFATFAGCDLSLRQPAVSSSQLSGYSSTYVEVYDHCADEPYYHSPEWCDWYDDGTTCCVWLSGSGWFEEYCQWEYGFCWDYNGSF